MLPLLCTTSVARLGPACGCLRPDAPRRECLAFGAIRLASTPALPLFIPRSPEALTESLGIVWLSISSQDKWSIAAGDHTLIAVDLPG
jgi:hypothetical protein